MRAAAGRQRLLHQHCSNALAHKHRHNAAYSRHHLARARYCALLTPRCAPAAYAILCIHQARITHLNARHLPASTPPHGARIYGAHAIIVVAPLTVAYCRVARDSDVNDKTCLLAAKSEQVISAAGSGVTEEYRHHRTSKVWRAGRAGSPLMALRLPT